jgi:hypothetical protein
MQPAPIKAVNAHIWEREVNEHYVEPAWCSERLFEVEVSRAISTIHAVASGPFRKRRSELALT